MGTSDSRSLTAAVSARSTVSWRIGTLLLAACALAGCDASGSGGPAGKQKPSRDVGDQVDSVMKDFKNE